MKCFTHHEKEAVGICKACQKGVCSDCAVDLGHSLACKSNCEKQVGQLNNVIQKNIVTMTAQKRNRNIQPAFFAAMGSMFLYFGVDGYPKSSSYLCLSMGLGFLIFSGIIFFVNRKWASEMDRKTA